MQVSNPPTQINGHRDSTAGLSRQLNTSTNGEIDQNGITSGSLEASTSNQAQTQVPFDTVPFRQYLLALLPPVLGATYEEIEEGIMADIEFEERVRLWASSGNIGVAGPGAGAGAGGPGGGVLYVAKIAEGLPGDEAAPPTYRYELTSTLTYSSSHVETLALIKRVPQLDSTAPMASQLQMLNLFGDEDTPYESLHAVVSLAVKPWFDAFVGTRPGVRDSDSKIGIPNAKKKFAELELSLFHLQQNVEIPETHLTIHPAITKAVEAARSTTPPTRITPSILPPALLSDSTFLNTLQSHVNTWIKAIQSVTKLTRDVSSGTASQEINFWLSLERALDGIDAQLHSDEVGLVLDCLRNAKRYLATVSFTADTGLKEGMELVRRYNLLMKDFPLDDLLSATDLPKIQDALSGVFAHLNNRLRRVPYPIRRALPLVEAISRDFGEVVLRVLTSARLIYQPYDTFEKIMTSAHGVFRTWDDCVKDFTNVAREVTRKRSEKFIPIKINPAHAKLVERVRYLRDWRKKHEQLAVTTAPSKGLVSAAGAGVGAELGGVDMEEEVKEAYEIIKNIDILDVSPEGAEIWSTAENAYNERIARVENQIIARLRDRLGTARNASEMFRVFSKFNALFVRPKILGAIREYQTQLIESVKEDIKHLHHKFKTQYRYSEAYHMSQMRDLPPIAGAIIWARQIERQLTMYMKRVEDVFGKEWELYADGQKLQTESLAFRKKLDTRQVYEAWLHEINRRDMGVSGRLFEIVKLRGSGTGTGGEKAGYMLAVNFDPQVITLFKEVRNLLWLGFQVPHAIGNMAKDAKRVYPHAVSLMETVRTYGQTLHLVEENQVIEMLVAEYRNEAQNMVTRGMSLRWDFFVNAYDTHRYLPAAGLDGRENRHIAFVREFASVVSVLQDKTNSLVNSYKEINRAIEDLSTCPYTHEAFAELISKVQSAVDRLNLEGYANLENWVAQVDDRIAGILSQRITHILQVWCDEFDKTDDGEQKREGPLRDITNKRRGEKRKEEKHVLDGNMTLKPIVHEIRIQNQVIFLDPPIEYARDTWFKQLHEWLGVVCRLRRIQSSRYEIGLQMQDGSAADLTYTFLLTHFTDGKLERAFSVVENKVQQLTDYVSKWLQFQSLWDLEAEYVFNRLGDSLTNWQQLLTEIKRTRSTFDTSETQKSLGGVCVIDYEQVQARVNAKYDSWQRDILSRFGVKLGNAMKEMHASILKARHDLEQQSIEGLTAGGVSRRV